MINNILSPGLWYESKIGHECRYNTLSPPAKITMGVPQGSILGQLLFLVYINGIQSELQHSKTTMFADDMAFYCHENSPSNLQFKLNADFSQFMQEGSVSTMVIPILEYASIVWGDKNNKVLMDSI